MKNAIIRTLPEAPQDNKLYGRNNAQWIEIDLSGLGTGDMNKAIYDPNLIQADIYDRGNHTGTQLSNTISDFTSAVTNTNAVVQNTSKVSFPEAPTDGTAYARMNSSWVATESFTDAPADGNEYIRKNSAWRLSDKLDDAPLDSTIYGRRNGTWAAATGGVTSVNNKTGDVSLTTNDIPEGSNLYFTDSRVSSNSSVAANTSKVSFPEAPSNGQYYSRRNGAWAVSSGLADAPSDDYRYVRKNGSWEQMSTADGIDYGNGNQYTCGASTSLQDFSTTLQNLFPDGTDLQGKEIILIINSSRGGQTLTIPRISNARIYISANPSSSTFSNCTFNLNCSNCHIRLTQADFSTNSSPSIVSEGFNNTLTLTALGINLNSNPNGLIEPTGFSQILFTTCSFSGNSFPRLIKRGGTGIYDPVTVTFYFCTGDIPGIVADGVGILTVRDSSSTFTFNTGAQGGAMFIQA